MPSKLRRWGRSLSLSLCLAVFSAGAVAAEGGPLPRGAIARLGTTRFRSGLEHPCFAVSPDGKYIALQDSYRVALLDAASGAVRHSLPHKDCEVARAFSPDSRLLLTQSGCAGWTQMWDVATGRLLWRKDNPLGRHRGGIFSADGKRFISWGEGEEVRIWEPITGKLCQRLPMPPSTDWDHVVASRNGTRLAFAVGERNLQVMELPGGKVVRALCCPYSFRGASLFLSPDGGRLAVFRWDREGSHLWDVDTGREVVLRGRKHWLPLQASRDGTVLVGWSLERSPLEALEAWDASTGKVLWSSPQPEGTDVPVIELAPDEKTFIRTWPDALVLVDLRTGKEVRRLAGQADQLYLVAYADQGRRVIASDRHALHSWLTATGQEVGARPGHLDVVEGLAFSGDSHRLATGTYDLVLVWEADTGRLLQTFHHYTGGLVEGNHLALSGRGARAAAWSQEQNGRVHVWDVDKGRECCRFDHRYTFIRRGIDLSVLALSPDSKTLAVSSPDASGVELHDADTGKLQTVAAFPKQTVRSLVFSPNSTLLAVAARGAKQSEVTVRAVAPDATVWTGPLPGDGPFSFSADGRLLATVDGKSAHVCELASGKVIRTFRSPVPLKTITFTRSRQVLAAAIGKDQKDSESAGAVIVWDVLAGRVACRLRPTEGDFAEITLAPNSSRLATALADTSVLVWDLDALLPPRQQAKKLGAGDGERLWKDLADTDAERAYGAVCKLAADPETAVSLLGSHLHPEPVNRRLLRLIAELDADDFTTREAAAKDLPAAGAEAILALRAALTRQPSLEARRRIERVLGQLHGRPLSPELLRQVRAVQALEYAGTPAARRLLQKLAGGWQDALLTREAKASLQRHSK